MIRHVSLRLREQYLDSFLYSGTLLLVGRDGALTSLDWEMLVLLTLKAHNRIDLARLFVNSREITALALSDAQLDFEIPDECLRESVTGAFNWEVWPTDLNVYANNVYLSDETGVHVLPFVLETKACNTNALRRIKSGYVYSIAPGEGGRLAVAGVEDGLSLLVKEGQHYSQQPLVEDDVFDCDWFGTKLVANSSSHAYLAKFVPLPKKKDYPDIDSFLSSLRGAKRAKPITSVLDHSSVGEYHWLAGRDVVMEDDDPVADPSIRKKGVRILKARSASFGSIVEYQDEIVLQRSGYRSNLNVREPIYWRTFARSKNYLNQLHVCDEDGLQFRAYEMRAGFSDRFSVEINDFED